MLPVDPREIGFYLSLSQIGLEMVGPVVLGLVLDHYLGWTPWGVVGGAVLGPVGGVWHLILLLQRREENSKRGDGP